MWPSAIRTASGVQADDLPRLSRLSGAGISLAGIVLLGVIAFAGMTSNNSATERERLLLQNALNLGIARALNEQKSVAWWDESVVKISDTAVDLDFADSNFGIFLTETYGHDEVYILNGSDKPLYAFAGGARAPLSSYAERQPALQPIVAEVRTGKTTVLAPRPDAFGADQTNYKTLGGPVQIGRWAGHIIAIDGRFVVAAAMTITPNVDMSLAEAAPKVLMTLTYIDDAYVNVIGRSLILNDLALTRIPSEAAGVVSEPFIGDDGTAGGYLTWTTERPGQVLLNVILPLVGLGVLAVAILAGGMLHRLRRTSNDLAEREALARHAARHDALSGLANRSHFADHLARVLTELSPDGEARVVVAYIDIDRFKDVNDTLGHQAGDELISAVARRLQARMRSGDFLARYGGDEFAVLWVVPNLATSETLAQRIAAAFLQPFDVHGHRLIATASAGIAIAPEHGCNADELMRHADIALYDAKSRGRNRAAFFSADMGRQVEERRQIELDLRDAMAAGQLRLNYQPIISSRTGAIVGVEALLRWRHADKGEISPAVFIPIAEQAGLMPTLGEWVLARAMQDWHRWPQLQVSVNLSPIQFRQAELEPTLRRLVAEHAVNPCQFVLEITEGVLMESSERTTEILDGIHRMGFLTALDDFGTGYSSLAYLCNFRFNKIKIDRAFVAGMSKSEKFRKIVLSVIALGKGLGMDIVAEGVETEEEATTITAFGCSELQGYYFSRPIEVDQLVLLLQTYVPTFPKAAVRATTGGTADTISTDVDHKRGAEDAA
ncbi:MAG: bifunctional diguanylate cyclase/phosphodiesterase [Hyphomicrobium sp.]